MNQHLSAFRLFAFSVVATLLVAMGCATTRGVYYNAWEKFGYAKRERLVDNVKAARQEQVDAKKEFATALDQFKSVVNFQGGNLETTYNKLNKEYERCEAQAGEVRSKIQAVKNVAQALFSEWSGEIGQMSDASLKQSNQNLLDKTKQSYGELVTRMDAASNSMNPVLQSFKDRVLFLKGNLNAQAIASLKGTEVQLGGDIDKLIKQMEESIKQADAFISEMQPAKS